VTDAHQQFHDVLTHFKTAMLVTRTPGGRLHARPLAIAQVQPDGDVLFATALESPKVAEIEADPEVLVTFQGGSRFAVVGGTAGVVRDRDLVDKLWSEAWRIWFPGGKDDPSLCLLRVKASDGEYWDNSGLKGLTYLYAGAKAYFTGTRVDTDDMHAHAKVKAR
jgi:general stress protein 26